jgi:hypothetical protein
VRLHGKHSPFVVFLLPYLLVKSAYWQPVALVDFLLRAALPPHYAKNHDYWAAFGVCRVSRVKAPA